MDVPRRNSVEPPSPKGREALAITTPPAREGAIAHAADEPVLALAANQLAHVGDAVRVAGGWAVHQAARAGSLTRAAGARKQQAIRTRTVSVAVPDQSASKKR